MTIRKMVLAAGSALALGALASGAAFAQGTGVSDAFRGFGANSNDPIQVEADAFEVQDRDQTAVLTGNVQVRQKDSTLKAVKVKIFYEGKGVAAAGSPGAQQIRRFEADGKVVINQGDQTATGDHGWFDMRSQTAQLTGNVVLAQGKSVGRGEKLDVDLRTGVYRLTGGRVQMLLEPSAPAKPKTP
ncbi:LptA/OstA family protein [Methyloraptor flagellatus]|uniref:LptA/OstA family protein n=1 Tax=Methyloraptor flagellatus TaxID=3162530 RepID=A0AAU7X7J7_9HYPH